MKSKSTAYICWFFLGCHYFYLGKPIAQIFFYLTLGGLGLWALIDLFRIGGMVDSYNRQRKNKL